MAATTDQLTALSQDGYFRQRVRNIALIVAAAVAAEVNTTPNHNGRSAYAFKLIGSPALADQLADFVCARTNLIVSTVTYDFAKRAVSTTATDVDIQGQIQNDWNMLSGIQT